MSELNIVIAASGTGGHLIPALCVARALKKICPHANVHFIGTGRPLEKMLIDEAGFVRHEIKLVGIKDRGLTGAWQFMRLLPGASKKVWRLLNEFKPRVVVGMGGYASVLPIVLASFLNIPTWIHEAELEAGVANRLLGLVARRISTAFPDTRFLRQSRVQFAGHPLREEILSVAKMERSGMPTRILCLGGSQGAAALDSSMAELAPFLAQHRLALWHQCRAESYERLERVFKTAGIQYKLETFIRDLAQAYSWCDIIVSRAGAGAVMEIGIVNIPAVLVPFPFAQGNHQLKNAQTLVRLGKALLVEEGDEFTERLRKALQQLLDPERYRAMRDLPSQFRAVDAAHTIAKGCLELAGV